MQSQSTGPDCEVKWKMECGERVAVSQQRSSDVCDLSANPDGPPRTQRLNSSPFGTHEFKALSTEAKIQYIWSHQAEIEPLTDNASDYLSTILIRSMCRCKFFDIKEDLMQLHYIEEKEKHELDCPALRNPVDKDLAESTLRRRQRRELLGNEEYITMILEHSAA